MLIFLIIAVILIILVNLIGLSISGPKYKGPITDHFDGKKFTNPTGIKAKGLSGVLKWALNRKRGEWIEIKNILYGEKPTDNVKDGLRITFVNHSTFLIQTGGLNIITDPVWSERTSPFQFAGPKRMRPPGIRYEDLPKIDLILLSHNHYDHLDLVTLKKIFNDHCPGVITPLGVKAFLEKKGIAGTADLDWWNEYQFDDKLKITATPAQHFSGRGTYDRDATLWCGYILETQERKIYFAGDTGYNNITFKEIGERFNSIDISLIPIGAYKPQWFMSPIHCSPEEAVKIHIDVKSKKSIATHYGTFPLADEGATEPIFDLQLALKKQNVNVKNFIALKEGVSENF